MSGRTVRSISENMKKRIAAVFILLVCAVFVLDLVGLLPNTPFPQIFIDENVPDNPSGTDGEPSDPGSSSGTDDEPSDSDTDGEPSNSDSSSGTENPSDTIGNNHSPGEPSEPSTQPADPDLPPEPSRPVNPLTGLNMDESEISRRPVAVMLNNLKKAQPQLGISQADIIYEIPVEGGITRMLAVYQSLKNVGNLGSIRSIRPYFIEIAMGHDALLVHAGGSTEAYRNISSWKVDNMDGVRGGSDANIFWRDSSRRKTMGYEHSMLTSGENVLQYLERGRYRVQHNETYTYPQTFRVNAVPSGGSDAVRVSVEFSNYKTGLFNYDAQKKKYMVSQYGSAYKDGNNGEQVGVTNLLILETNIKVLDSEGRLQVRTTGSGKGTFYCGGKSVPVQWNRESRSVPFIYTLEDGSPLVMENGNSYVCIIDPESSTVSVSN